MGKGVIINVLIVDDEIEACDNIVNMLHDYVESEINIVGVANDTTQAEKMIRELKPDAVFLDIEMPGENAFQFLQRINHFDFEIVFVTAYDQFAIQAFKLNAVDYMLKPISIDELTDAVHKLKQRVELRNFAQSRDHQLEVLKNIGNKEKQQKLALKGANNIEMVDFKDIFYIEGSGSYSLFCIRKKNECVEMTVSNSIYEYEAMLPADMFFRIHKSYLINCTHIQKIVNDESCAVFISNTKTQLPVSRRRFAGFIDFLKLHKFNSD